MARVVVVGSINVDVSVRSATLPRPGETLLGSDLRIGLGGKGANQAVAARYAGAEVQLIGAVGDDEFGRFALAELTRRGVDVGRVRTTSEPTGVAQITVSDDGENTIVVAPGANSALTELTDAERGAIGDAQVLLLQLEIPLATTTASARLADANGTAVVLNPSPLQPLPDDLAASTTVLVVNESEAAALPGFSTAAASDHPLPRFVIVTRGGHGASVHEVGHGALRVRTSAVNPVDTTGAGDVFAGTLAAHWGSVDEIDDLRTPTQSAVDAATRSVTMRGTGFWNES
ncbi:ribokinase [Jongsikchunia kroppenstedtii]|uniref:ribokinase n=1 Tax=Jongsikchunia kroppenstedtii TaxID=1121721 RepID=UPI000369213D|nr:ribokinase [Jongsikchunia kroppenstedtii]